MDLWLKFWLLFLILSFLPLQTDTHVFSHKAKLTEDAGGLSH